MSQHKHKLKNILSFIFVSLAVAFALAGCRDELLYSPTDIPDADVDLAGEVVFRPLVATEVQTRAGDTQAPAGASYKGIKTLYIFFFDEDQKLIKQYTGPVSFSDASTESTTLQRVRFDMWVHAGKYYVYAVANVDASALNALKNKEGVTIADLKNLKLEWNDNLADDLEMFGVFQTSGSNTKPEDVENSKFEYEAEAYDESVTITPTSNTIHSWVRRAVSKVTVDFNGSQLKEGVTVYIEKAVLKDLPSGAFLGAQSKATNAAQKEETVAEGETSSADGFSIIEDSKYALIYGKGTDAAQWPQVTKTGVFKPNDVWKAADAWNGMTDDSEFHDDDAWALPCYENMQGDGTEENQKYQDKNGDGIIDSYHKDNMPYGTYLEVTGYYKSDRPEYKSEGPIVYRFMLGQDAEKNFDLIRNHHYKITMNFKDYGNDIDWHIEYKNRFLEATEPQDVNYRGEFFVPSENIGWANAGHEFNNTNEIILTSYESDNKSNTLVDVSKVEYVYKVWNSENNSWIDITDESSPDYGWLEEEGNPQKSDTQITYKFRSRMSNPKVVDLDARLKASPGGGSLGYTETANSYIVNGYGTYTLPLVYGNGNVGLAIDEKSTLPKNYLGAPISNAKIIEDLTAFNKSNYRTDNNISYTVDVTKLEAKLIWQDAEGLITVNPELQGNNISFTVNSDKIKQGNAVIALVDPNCPSSLDHESVNHDGHLNTHAVWSWHIWVTRFGSDDFEKNILVRNHDEDEFDVLPVHLGWCSTDPVVYYPRRKCEITFTTEKGDEIKRTIMQYPHFALTRGDHPYYQWGRKDPFVGSNTPWGNKPRWELGKTMDIFSGSNPPRMFNEPTSNGTHDDQKLTTQQCLNELIKNPEKWHNAPRVSIDPKVPETDDGYYDWFNHINGFYSDNKTFARLWGDKKTIYDPCPPGYQVGSDKVFSGLTVNGQNNIADPTNVNDVLEKYMVTQYEYIDENGAMQTGSLSLKYYDATLGLVEPWNGVNGSFIEFYSDTKKLQSISFPVSGYRDYDSYATVYNMTAIGFVWSNRSRMEKHDHRYTLKVDEGDSFAPERYHPVDGTCAYHLKFTRAYNEDWTKRTIEVEPREDFFDTDGFAVRPVSTSKPQIILK